MKKLWGKKQISIGLIIVLFISLIYAENSDNLGGLVILAFILTIYKLLEAIWVIRSREYKTTYLIVLSDVINIFCNISLIFLVTRNKNFSDIEQIVRYLSIRSMFLAMGYFTLLASMFLSSSMYKTNRGSETL